MARKELYYWW